MKTPAVYWRAAAVWILPGIVLGAAGYGAKDYFSSDAGQFEQPAPTAIAERAFPGVRVTYVGSGLFRVPSQVAPGKYLITATDSTFGCTWKRLRADDEKPKSLIAGDTISRGGFDQFTVAASDKLLSLDGNCTWARQ